MKIWAIILQVFGILVMLFSLIIIMVFIDEGLDSEDPEGDIISLILFIAFGLSLFYNGKYIKFIRNRMQQGQVSDRAITTKKNFRNSYDNHNLPWEK